jgi:solute carrier family 25 oxoglutarate transporter 11
MSTDNSFFNQYGKPYLVGAISGSIASSVIQPIDTVKVVIQNRREAAGKGSADLNPIRVAKDIIKKNGVLSLYKGLDAAIMRQVIYCGLRLGLYKSMEDRVKLG